MEYKNFFKKISGLVLLTFFLAVFLGLVNFHTVLAAPLLSNSGGGSWSQKYRIGIGNSLASALTDYQFRVDLTTAVFGNPYTNIKVDGSDIRFTNSAGQELPYWIEESSWNNTGNSIVWVKVDSIAASPAITKIYMYYGNPSATSSSSGQNTFKFFDDFDAPAVNAAKWTTVTGPSGGTVSVSSGALNISGPAALDTGGRVQGKVNFNAGNAARFRYKQNNVFVRNYDHGGFSNANTIFTGNDPSQVLGSEAMAISLVYTGAMNCTASSCTGGFAPNYIPFAADTAYHNYDIGWTNTAVSFFKDDVNKGNLTGNIPTVSLPITFKVTTDGNIAPTARTLSVDWVIVRQYVNPEPAIAPPSCTLFTDAENNAVWKGETATLSWVTVNATNPVISGIGPVSPAESGSITVGPINNSTTYTMTAAGPSGPISCPPLTIGVKVLPTGGLVPCGRLADNPATTFINEQKPCDLCSAFYMLKKMLNFTMEIAIGIAVFILVIAGLLYAFSVGNPGNIEKAKSAITYAILGLFIIFVAWLIVAIILNAMGYADITKWNQVNCTLQM